MSDAVEVNYFKWKFSCQKVFKVYLLHVENGENGLKYYCWTFKGDKRERGGGAVSVIGCHTARTDSDCQRWFYSLLRYKINLLLSAGKWDCGPWYFNSIAAQCGRVIQRSGQTIMHCIMSASIRSYRHSQDRTGNTGTTQHQEELIFKKLFPPSARHWKAPLAIARQSYISHHGQSCWSRAAGPLGCQPTTFVNLRSSIVLFEFKDCQSRALGIQFAEGE